MFQRFGLTALLCLVLFPALPAFPAEVETPLSKVQSYEDAVVTVRAQQASFDGRRATVAERTGAGVIIDPRGYIVTNTHIIYGSNIIRIVFKDGAAVSAQVPFVSREYDFSILKIDPPFALTPVEWSDQAAVELGQPVITIGHSPLLDRTISGGQIRGLGTRTQEDGSVTPESIEISINHYSGDSGGPVFNLSGQFVGLINAKRVNQQRAAFAVPAYKIELEYLKLVRPPEKQ